jgi:hypothetical protein
MSGDLAWLAAALRIAPVKRPLFLTVSVTARVLTSFYDRPIFGSTTYGHCCRREMQDDA